MKDITSRMLAEEAIRASEKKFRTLSEQSMLGIVIARRAGMSISTARLPEYQVIAGR
ncbi:MAG: hypothetical protein LLG37_04480 [Spirochaetia bacterium]|nr:hypothetical protein [Spirochaetia bacterium]